MKLRGLIRKKAITLQALKNAGRFLKSLIRFLHRQEFKNVFCTGPYFHGILNSDFYY